MESLVDKRHIKCMKVSVGVKAMFVEIEAINREKRTGKKSHEVMRSFCSERGKFWTKTDGNSSHLPEGYIIFDVEPDS